MILGIKRKYNESVIQEDHMWEWVCLQEVGPDTPFS